MSKVQDPKNSGKRYSCGAFADGTRTELWRTFSWQVGDAHANRLCWLIDAYCWLFRVDPRRLWGMP